MRCSNERMGNHPGRACAMTARQPRSETPRSRAVGGGHRKLIVEVYNRAASPDRVGPVQDPVWAKNVVARRIAIDGPGLVGPKGPPHLDPETLSSDAATTPDGSWRTDRACSGPEPAAAADSPAAVTLAKASDIAAARNAFQSCCLSASRQGGGCRMKTSLHDPMILTQNRPQAYCLSGQAPSDASVLARPAPVPAWRTVV
jgi:hypothetical protein